MTGFVDAGLRLLLNNRTERTQLDGGTTSAVIVRLRACKRYFRKSYTGGNHRLVNLCSRTRPSNCESRDYRRYRARLLVEIQERF